jgi:hypothetical protein
MVVVDDAEGGVGVGVAGEGDGVFEGHHVIVAAVQNGQAGDLDGAVR